MRIIVDTNIVIAGLLRDGTTRQLLFNPPGQLHGPAALPREVLAHEDLLRCRGVDRNLVESLLEKIVVLEEDAVNHFIPKAQDIMQAIHSKDVPFLACALAISGSVIWSNDAHFKQQAVIPVFTTSELVLMLNERE